MELSYFDYYKKHMNKVDDVLRFLTKYVNNLTGKNIQVKIGEQVCTDMVGNIYITIEKIIDYLEKGEDIKDAAIQLLSDILHEIAHWFYTDKKAWDDGVNKYDKSKQTIIHFLINALEDGRCEAHLMNDFYGCIYPILYTNNIIFQEKEKEDLSVLMSLLKNIISMSVNYKIKIDVDESIKLTQDKCIDLMKEKNIWILPNTEEIVKVADDMMIIIQEFLDNNQQQDSQGGASSNQTDNQNSSNNQSSQQNQPNSNQSSNNSDNQNSSSSEDSQNNQGSNDSSGKSSQNSTAGQQGQSSDSSSNGQSKEGSNTTKNNQSKQTQPNGSASASASNGDEGKENQGQQNKSNSDNSSQESKPSSSEKSNNSLSEKEKEQLKSFVKNYNETAPGKDSGYQEEVNRDDHIDFSQISTQLEINLDQIKMEELDDLVTKYEEPIDYVYTSETPKGNFKNKNENKSPIAIIPDLKNLPNQFSTHVGIPVALVNLQVNAVHQAIYEQNKAAMTTDIEELLFILRNILKRKQENDSESMYTGYIDPLKLNNIAFDNLDIFRLFESFSNDIKNSIFISVDLSGSMLPRQKYVIKSLILLHEVLKQLKVKHSIWGFNTNSMAVCHYPLIPFDSCFDDETSSKIAAIHTNGANRDGLSIRVFNEYIKENNQNPLYITITDGNPNHYQYSGDHAIEDTKQAIEELSLPTIAICIGDKENMNISKVYDNAIECSEVYEMPNLLQEFLIDIMN